LFNDRQKNIMATDFVLSRAVTSTLTQLLEYQTYVGNISLNDFMKQMKLSYVAAAASLYVVATFYKSLSYPKKFAHIAHVPATKTLRSFINGSTNVDRARQLFIPHCLETKGLVAKYAQFGWEVTVISPEAVRAVFRNPGKHS
jgi:hypothetical protein